LPAQWWNVFSTIFRYYPNSLVHGILFPAMGIKLSRVLTATLDAFGADRVATAGVKFDKLGKTNSGQPIFAKDEETASEIRATFVIDLSLIRSFGRGNNGLSVAQKQLLLAFTLWKVGKLLGSSFRFRSECDLGCTSVKIDGEAIELSSFDINMQTFIQNAGFQTPLITKIHWGENELFKTTVDTSEVTAENDEENSSNDNE
jgi:CRISPR-associated protein Csb1